MVNMIKKSASKNKKILKNPSFSDEELDNALEVVTPHVPAKPVSAPIISSYDDHIRPLLDVVDRLRNLNVMKEGIQLPTIVVVGDQSSGKSSVLESLAGISLPRGQGICTRVPLIMRLQHHTNENPEFFLEFNEKIVSTDEDHISDAICAATDEMAGEGKGISNAPLTLVVKKRGVPDLTMVDLPGITRVPVHGQPENIYEQIADMIMEYIKPEASIILNVLSANVDFTTCESIRMSRKVDKTGERTLAVVTKADKAPEGLYEKVTADEVNIGLGYVCVRNRIGDESYEEAREKERDLFETHPLLSLIDECIVGIPVLAKKLVQIQADIISKCLPDIVNTIREKLNSNVNELNKMPKCMSSVPQALAEFMQIIGAAKDSLRKVLVRGEFEDFPDDEKMHCTARLAEMLNHFSDEIQKSVQVPTQNGFLTKEMRILEEAKWIGLPNFLPRTAFLTILQENVKEISKKPVVFVDEVWDYIETVLVRVIMQHTDNYPQLQFSTKRAVNSLVSRMKEMSLDRVEEFIEMEKVADFTCNPEYMSEWNNLISFQDEFLKLVLHDEEKPSTVVIPGYGGVDVCHLRAYPHILHQAYDLKMRFTSYWKIVMKRVVDCLALHLIFAIQNLVNKELEKEIINEMLGPSGNGVEKMLEESPAMASKRKKLSRSIKLLKESKEVLSKVSDRITLNFD